MDMYVTGSTIKTLREKKGMTQSVFAEKINISDKAISKWETGKGYPDITLLDPIAKVFGVSVSELISGKIVSNSNISSNMLKSALYVCPVCGNIIHSMGEALISCHGIELIPLIPEEEDECHKIKVEKTEDEYYVTVDHQMTKNHYISFIASLNGDKFNIVKLYPEGNAQARFKINDTRILYFYCNKDGLFRKFL